MLIRTALSWFVLVAAIQPALAGAVTTSLPAWIAKAIAERRGTNSHDSIEESTYGGKRVFLITAGDRADTGDEHKLFDETGKEMCQFGGLAGHVTAGACDLDKIMYVRTLYPAKSK